MIDYSSCMTDQLKIKPITKGKSRSELHPRFIIKPKSIDFGLIIHLGIARL